MDMDVEIKHANIKYTTPIVIFIFFQSFQKGG